MEMKTRYVGLVTIVDIRGRVTFGESDAALREAILGLLDKGRKQILLNLEDTSYVDSSGLAQFVACYKEVDEVNGMVKLLRHRKRIRQLLHLTGLDTVLEVVRVAVVDCGIGLGKCNAPASSCRVRDEPILSLVQILGVIWIVAGVEDLQRVDHLTLVVRYLRHSAYAHSHR